MGDSADTVAALLYGDGAWEIAKSLGDERKNRTQARVGLATNVVGIAAGTAGLKEATDKYRGIRSAGKPPKMPKVPGATRGFLKPVAAAGESLGKPLRAAGALAAKHPGKLAAAAVGLQAANLGGDFVANRVLARNAKKQGISKDVKELPHSSAEIKTKAVSAATKGTFKAIGNHGPKVAQLASAAKQKATEQSPKFNWREQKQVTKSFDITWSGEISKMDTDKRQVFGWASIVEKDGKPVVDLQGDYLSVDEIEKAAYTYVQNSRKGGNQHQRDGEGPRHVSDMIESFLVTDEKKAQMGLPDSVPTGWWVGFQVNDDETWDQVKRGEKKGFSIHGSGVRKEMVLEDS